MTDKSFRVKNDLLAGANVGIGNTSPGYPLVIGGTAAAAIEIRDGGDIIVRNVGNSGNAMLYCDTAGQLNVTSDLKADRNLLAANSIGVGTNSPGYPIDVYRNTTGNYGAIRLWSGSSSDTAPRVIIKNDIPSYEKEFQIINGAYAKNLSIYDATGSSYLLSINQYGNMNLGTGSAITDTGYRWFSVIGSSSTVGGVVQTQTSGGEVTAHIFNNSAAGYIGTGTNHPLVFRTNAQEKMRITPAGNVGIGVDVPAQKLHVQGSSTYLNGGYSAARFDSGETGGTGGQIQLYNSSSGATSPSKYLRVDGAGRFQIVNSAYNRVPLSIDDGGNMAISGFFNSSVASPLNCITANLNDGAHDCTGVIATAASSVYNADFFGGWFNGTNYFRVGVDGHLESRGHQYVNGGSYRIQNASAGMWQYSHDLDIDGGIKTYSINMDSAATAFAFSTEDNFTYGTETFWVYASGDVTAAGNVTAYSDIKLKTDVATIDNALDKVSKMRGVMYTRKDTGLRGTGVIAQEIQEVLPEVVMEGETLSVAYGNIVGVLIEAIKELEARVKQLENK